MFERSTNLLLALSGGLLLALMISTNSLLAKHSTPLFASWVAHGVGAMVAFTLVLLSTRAFTRPTAAPAARAPLWFYLGGIPGAFTVILSAITVNGSLALSGTIALILVGQVLFGILSDHFGLFRTPRRRITVTDFAVVALVLTGSALIIFGA